MKSIVMAGLASAILAGSILAGCKNKGTSSDEQVILYTNADDEAVAAMQNALDSNGYEGKYLVQTFGTSELGGRRGHRGGYHYNEFFLYRKCRGRASYVSGSGI